MCSCCNTQIIDLEAPLLQDRPPCTQSDSCFPLGPWRAPGTGFWAVTAERNNADLVPQKLTFAPRIRRKSPTFRGAGATAPFTSMDTELRSFKVMFPS